MPIMTNADRAELWREFQEALSADRSVLAGSLSKAELRAAIDAIDQWTSDNAAALNAAIPQPARGVLTAAQKARLFAAVVLKRYVKGA